MDLEVHVLPWLDGPSKASERRPMATAFSTSAYMRLTEEVMMTCLFATNGCSRYENAALKEAACRLFIDAPSCSRVRSRHGAAAGARFSVLETACAPARG